MRWARRPGIPPPDRARTTGPGSPPAGAPGSAPGRDVHVTVITMGPPQANDLLFECIAKGADEGILVSDRAVGGSDTWATSNTLEAAVKKGVKENGDYDLIFTGRQAIDGDTAQVGPQLAEKLGLPSGILR